jgi:uncharacterized protein (DUF433 family)
MIACKRIVTVGDEGEVVLSDLPFRSGQRVEVVMLAEELTGDAVDELRSLLRDTQALPCAREITEDQIAEEIAAYRSRQEEIRMNITDYVVSDSEVMMGKPVIRGTRITVELILEKLAAGESVEQLLEAHPRLTKKAILAALGFAAESIKAEVAHPLRTAG